MQVIFAKGKSLISDAIAHVSDTDVSHVALASSQIFKGELVFHSTAAGVKISSRSAFNAQYDIKRVYEIPVARGMTEEFYLWSLIQLHEDKKYDYFAAFYIGFYLLLKRLGINLPKENRWQNRNYFICTEFASIGVMGDTDSMITLKTLEEYILQRMQHNGSGLQVY